MLKINFMLVAALLGGLAVILGAFAAHGLEQVVDVKMLNRFHTGVEYQFYHVFALLLVGGLYQLKPYKPLHLSGLFFLSGILLFSGSLYAYVLTANKLFVILTPIGGLCFIIAWMLLAYCFYRVNFFESH
jgi:uncharacterized membrane protein YgdD (TMEM256/DUF423 family)